LRVDRANSHQSPTGRRGFLATLLAGLGLTPRPTLAAPPIPPELAVSLKLYGDDTRFVVLPPGRDLPPLGFETSRHGLGNGWCLAVVALFGEGTGEAEVRRDLRMMTHRDPDEIIPPGTFDPSRLGFRPR
jgi:hypothetical protein